MRIEEIKSRIELSEQPQMDGLGYPSYWAVDDVPYLVHLLEIAEKALESAETDLRDYCGANGNIAAAYQVIVHTLQLIRS